MSIIDAFAHPTTSFSLNLASSASSAQNHQLVLPINPGLKLSGKEKVFVSSLQFNNSFYNISSANSNNSFSYTYEGKTTTTSTITFPDGNYTESQMNDYLQSEMYSNGHYTLDSDGNPYYYIEIYADTYSNKVAIALLPLSVPSGGTDPQSFYANADASQKDKTLTFTIPSGNFATLTGFTADTYPTTGMSAVAVVEESSSTPRMDWVSSIIMTCNICSSNSNTIFQDYIKSFALPSDATSFSVVDIPLYNTEIQSSCSGIFNQIIVGFYDQDNKPIVFTDRRHNITITIAYP